MSAEVIRFPRERQPTPEERREAVIRDLAKLVERLNPGKPTAADREAQSQVGA